MSGFFVRGELVVIVMHVSLGIVFQAHVSVGMCVPPTIYIIYHYGLVFPIHSPPRILVLRSQTAFLRFSLWWRKNGLTT